MIVAMPIYEFECKGCGARFEELVDPAAAGIACPECGSGRLRRLISAVSPPSRQPRGAAVRSGESRRRERETARQDRIAESRQKRAAGETAGPPAERGKG
jgi:putative FmdB family regulatory protein